MVRISPEALCAALRERARQLRGLGQRYGEHGTALGYTPQQAERQARQLEEEAERRRREVQQ